MKKEWELRRWSDVDHSYVSVYAVEAKEGRKDWPWDLVKVFTLERGLVLLAQRDRGDERFHHELRNIRTNEVIHGDIIQT